MKIDNLRLESRVLLLAERIQNGELVEDDHVECKADWPDPVKAARQIAGHANSASPDPILWLIGLDERRKRISRISDIEFSNWWSQVLSHFDQLGPSVNLTMVIVGNTSVAALQIDTNRPPYVVKNRDYGSPGAGPVEREVPWRSNNSTRTAHRDDLVRMLAPLTKKPVVEIVTAALQLPVERSIPKGLILTVDLYFVPGQGTHVVYPKRLIEFTVRPFDSVMKGVGMIRFEPDEPSDSASKNRSTRNETIIHEPGLFRFQVFADFADCDIPTSDVASVGISFREAYAKTVLSVNADLIRLNPGKDAPVYGMSTKK